MHTKPLGAGQRLNGEVAYTLLKSRRARRVRLAVHRDGSVVVTTPYGVPAMVVENFVQEKRDWLLAKIGFFAKFTPHTTMGNSQQEYTAYKEKARRLVEERLGYFNQLYYMRFYKVTIRNQKTRWGSCSAKGNLNFNYKIVLLPPRLADYIIVHELCHVREFNHSKKFWQLVALAIPEYKEIRAKLRRIGLRFY